MKKKTRRSVVQPEPEPPLESLPYDVQVERRFGEGWSLVAAKDTLDEPETYARLGPNVPIDDTYFVLDPEWYISHLITITPLGLWLGWDDCSVCLRTMNTCECKSGVSLAKAVGYIYQKDGGVLPAIATREHVPLPPRLALREPVTIMRRKGEARGTERRTGR